MSMAFIGDLNEKMDAVEDRSFEPIPAGWYTAVIKSADIKDTKAGTGKILNIRFDITGPARAGAVIFVGLNIRNPNPTAETIALQDMKAIRAAIGMAQVTDTDQLVGRAIQIKVDIQPAKDGYDAKNVVKGYKALEGGAMPMPAAGVPGVPKPAQAKAAPPWARPAVQAAPAAVTEGKAEEPEADDTAPLF
jgi:hypothetical protein